MNNGGKPKDTTPFKARKGQSAAGGRTREGLSSGEAPNTTYGSNVSESTVGSLAQGDHARAVTIVHHHHGLSHSDTKDLFLLLWKQNFPKLAKTARAEARRRVDEFASTFARVAAEQQVTEEQFSEFGEPDIQFILTAAIQASARRDNVQLRGILARLIVQRLRAGTGNLESLVLGEAVVAAGKLARNQLHMLVLCFLTMYAEWFDGSVTWSAANEFLQRMIAPFVREPACFGDLLYIEYSGCASVDRGRTYALSKLIAHRYGALFGIEKRESLHDLKHLSSVIDRESPILSGLMELSERVQFSSLNPTTVGVVLAVTAIEQVTGKRLPIDKWLG